MNRRKDFADMTAAGHRNWYIADAFLPSTGRGERWESHESLCVLNTGERDARLRLTLFFEDREPIVIDPLIVEGRRDRHIGMHRPEQLGGTVVPRDTPYGIAVASDQPIVVQYSRLDVTQPNFALMTCIPFTDKDAP